MKTFTLEEANALLPSVKAMLDEMTGARAKIIASGSSLESVLKQAGGNGGSKKAGGFVLLLQRFNASLEALRDLGVELKDLDQGLVDFPSYRGGELVYLCWKRGEEQIGFWHSPESGFAGRQPI